MLRIGFFIPEFPGQTHIFLWREQQALAELGIEADLISTRPPPRAVAASPVEETSAPPPQSVEAPPPLLLLSLPSESCSLSNHRSCASDRPWFDERPCG